MARFISPDLSLVEVVERGTVMTIPVDPANRHYQRLVADNVNIDPYLETEVPHEVSKLTIVDRLEAAGLRTAAKAALSANEYQKDRWDSAAVIRSDDQTVRTLLISIDANPDDILAREGESPLDGG